MYVCVYIYIYVVCALYSVVSCLLSLYSGGPSVYCFDVTLINPLNKCEIYIHILSVSGE